MILKGLFLAFTMFLMLNLIKFDEKAWKDYNKGIQTFVKNAKK